MAPEVIYCFRCGKHVKREGGKCWYCSAPTRRVIRPPRKCSFCDEEIGHKAVKCPHCGEFLDGRPKMEPPRSDKGPLQIFYVIDKAVIQGDRPLMLRGGETVPPDVARSLTHRTLEAIHSNNPLLVDQVGVRALPAPGSQSVDAIDAELVESSGDSRTRLINYRGKGGAPVRREDAPPAPDQTWSGQMTRALVRGVGHALTMAGDAAYAMIRGAAPEPEASPQAAANTADDRYITCKFCDTEALREDNYCFHCGSAFGKPAKPKIDDTRMMPQQDASNAGLLFLAGLMAGGLIFLKLSGIQLDFAGGEWVAPGLAALCPLVLLKAFFRRRTFLTALLVAALGALWAGAVWLTYLA